MGWLRRFVIGSDFDRLADQDAAEMMARNNILEASRRDERRRRMLDQPPPVIRWRYQHRSWMRWSELDADWIMAEIPTGLLTFAATLDEVADGTTVGFVREEWQVLDDAGEPAKPDHVATTDGDDGPAKPTSPPPEPDEASTAAASAAEPEVPSDAATTGVVDAPSRSEPAPLSVADQISAWRRRH